MAATTALLTSPAPTTSFVSSGDADVDEQLKRIERKLKAGMNCLTDTRMMLRKNSPGASRLALPSDYKSGPSSSAASPNHIKSKREAASVASPPTARHKSSTSPCGRGPPRAQEERNGKNKQLLEKEEQKFDELKEEFFGPQWKQYKNDLKQNFPQLSAKIKRRMIVAQWNLRTRRVKLEMLKFRNSEGQN
ncbi:unnamed protein product [Amoebophrya sp. A120]|nr:unnamed protein product [Amoebophrya sp. A120]|eukprot:GSA120T00024467001.1